MSLPAVIHVPRHLSSTYPAYMLRDPGIQLARLQIKLRLLLLSAHRHANIHLKSLRLWLQNFTRRLREEQDAAYQESLREDQERERQRSAQRAQQEAAERAAAEKAAQIKYASLDL